MTFKYFFLLLTANDILLNASQFSVAIIIILSLREWWESLKRLVMVYKILNSKDKKLALDTEAFDGY